MRTILLAVASASLSAPSSGEETARDEKFKDRRLFAEREILIGSDRWFGLRLIDSAGGARSAIGVRATLRTALPELSCTVRPAVETASAGDFLIRALVCICTSGHLDSTD
jgi:hypothetical protein